MSFLFLMWMDKAFAYHNGINDTDAPVSNNTVVGWSWRVWDLAGGCWLIRSLQDGTESIGEDAENEVY